MKSILRELQIYGIPDSTESAILASFMNGDPCLLIGPPGTAKTESVEMIGAALREKSKRDYPNDRNKWFTYQLYDTSKLNPEDLIGFPDPNALKKGQMGFIKTPGTIWDKHLLLLDELNRCDKSRQSNLFEVIRSRRLNGIPTNNEFIVSAINPLGDVGTQEMSDALVDRHMFYLTFNSFSEMDDDNRMSVIKRVGTHEGVGFRYWANEKFDLDTEDEKINDRLADVGDKISEIIKEGINIYKGLKDELGNKFSKLIARLTDRLADDSKTNGKKHSFEISGRRASMMMRGLLALRSIQLAKAGVLNTEVPPLDSTVINGVSMLLPIGIGQKMPVSEITRLKTMVTTDVTEAFELLFSDDQTADIIYSIYKDKNPLSRLERLLAIDDLSSISKHNLWTDLKQLAKDSFEIELILSSIKKTLPHLVPEHMVIDEHKVYEAMNKAHKTPKIDIYAPYSTHASQIEATLASFSGEKHGAMYSFCYIKTIEYLNKYHQNVSQREAIDNISRMGDLMTTIRNRVKELEV